MRILFSIITCALLACCAIQSPQAGPVGFRLSSTGFNPTTVSGMAAWWAARKETFSNNDPVGTVTDFTGNGRSLTQAPATHGWCGVTLSAAKEAQVQALIDANPSMNVVWRKYDIGTQPNYPETVLAELGLQRIVTPMI